MRITINLTNKEYKHLCSPHTFYECCKEAEDVLKKVQEQIGKKYTPTKKRLNKTEKQILFNLANKWKPINKEDLP